MNNNNFVFNFGSNPEPEEEITPPPSGLEGVVFSFVPAPISELEQIEKNYQKILEEWDHVRKLSQQEQEDLLNRSCAFITSVKPGQFGLDKFKDKMEAFYTDLHEGLKTLFIKKFGKLIAKRFAGLELDLDKKLVSSEKNEVEFALATLAAIINEYGGGETQYYIAKYAPIYQKIFEDHLNGTNIIKNEIILYTIMLKFAGASRFNNQQANAAEIMKAFKKFAESVIDGQISKKDYPSTGDEQALWWQKKGFLCKAFHLLKYGGRRQAPTALLKAFEVFINYIGEQKLVIPAKPRRWISRIFSVLSRQRGFPFTALLTAWDHFLFPALLVDPAINQTLLSIDEGVKLVIAEEDVMAELDSPVISAALDVLTSCMAPRTNKCITMMERITNAIKSDDWNVKQAGLKCLCEVLPKADYERDHIANIVSDILIPAISDPILIVRARACRCIGSLNTQSKRHLKASISPMLDKLFELLLKDNFVVKYNAIIAINHFAVKLDGEHLMESKITEGHIREILGVHKHVPLFNVRALLKADVFINHAPMFLKETLMRACEISMNNPNDDDQKIVLAADYLSFAKDIFLSDRIVASKATLQAIEPIIIQFMEHPAVAKITDGVNTIEYLDVIGFATYHIPVLTAEFWTAFRPIFNAFTTYDMPEEFFLVIGNYIARAPEHFLSIPHSVRVVLDKITGSTELMNDPNNWEFVNEVLTSLGKIVPEVVTTLIPMTIKLLGQARGSIVPALFRVLWAGLYIDTDYTLRTLTDTCPKWWKKWEKIQTRTVRFGRVGKKIVALGMISVLAVPMLEVPKALLAQTDGLAKIFKQLIPLLVALQDFYAREYEAPIARMKTTSAESEKLVEKAKTIKPSAEENSFEDVFGSDEDDVMEDEDLEMMAQAFEGYGGEHDEGPGGEIGADLDEEQFMDLPDNESEEGDEDGVEENEDETKSALLEIDELMLLHKARKIDPMKFETILGALDEDLRNSFEELLKKVKVGPNSLLEQTIEFVGRHYERYESDPNMKRLNADVLDRVQNWLVTPQPVSKKE